MRRFSLIAAAVSLSLVSCITINLPGPPGPLKEHEVGGSGKDKVLLIDLSGVISDAEEEGTLTSEPSMVARIKEELTKAGKDDRIKAVVLRINSPGGTVTASDIIYHEIKQFKAKQKVPVIASIMDVGASGGYYIAMAADKVFVHPSTVTGSIGVIMLTANAQGLLEKIGVHANAITSGPRKDMGSPFRAMSDEERAIFQSVINSFYDRFLAVVHEGRPNLPMDQVRKLADGRIYSGEQAKALGLVDGIGYLDEAVELARNQAGVTDAKIVTYQQPREYKNNIYSQMMAAGPMAGFPKLDLRWLMRSGTPQFMYLWMP